MNERFTKRDICWQCTVVKFRNGLLGLAVRDKRDNDDYDGQEQFMIYDPKLHKFTDAMFLSNYTYELRCKLSVRGILNRIEGVFNIPNTQDKNLSKIPLGDTDYDVVAVNVYPYALDAFISLTKDVPHVWLYNINKQSAK